MNKTFNLEDYKEIDDLGKGSFADVVKVMHQQTKQIFALKKIHKYMLRNQFMLQQIQRQIQIQLNICHPNIITLYRYFQDQDFIYLLLQYANEGCLCQRFKRHNQYGQQLTLKYIKELVLAIEYLQTRDPPIVHRDIKPQNILISNGVIKLADFGSANLIIQKRVTFAGTCVYMSPQMLLNLPYDFKTDIWSLGVLIYQMLTGQNPFMPKIQMNIITNTFKYQQMIANNIINVAVKYPLNFPPMARNLLSKILLKDPQKRLSIFDIKNHLWLKCAKQKVFCQTIRQNIYERISDFLIKQKKNKNNEQEKYVNQLREQLKKLMEEQQRLRIEKIRKEIEYQNQLKKQNIKYLKQKLNKLEKKKQKLINQIQNQEQQILLYNNQLQQINKQLIIPLNSYNLEKIIRSIKQIHLFNPLKAQSILQKVFLEKINFYFITNSQLQSIRMNDYSSKILEKLKELQELQEKYKKVLKQQLMKKKHQ